MQIDKKDVSAKLDNAKSPYRSNFTRSFRGGNKASKHNRVEKNGGRESDRSVDSAYASGRKSQRVKKVGCLHKLRYKISTHLGASLMSTAR